MRPILKNLLGAAHGIIPNYVTIIYLLDWHLPASYGCTIIVTAIPGPSDFASVAWEVGTPRARSKQRTTA